MNFGYQLVIHGPEETAASKKLGMRAGQLFPRCLSGPSLRQPLLHLTLDLDSFLERQRENRSSIFVLDLDPVIQMKAAAQHLGAH